MKTGKTLRSRRLRRYFSDPWTAAATALLILLVLACIVVPFFLKYSYKDLVRDPADGSILLRTPPTAENLLGTDNLGRDMLARLTYGGRFTLGITALATLIAAVLGGTLGVLSGYRGGRLDFYVMRVVDALASIPGLFLAIVMECAMGWGKGSFVYGLAIAAIAPFAKTVRAAAMDVSGKEYIEASRVLGASGFQVMRRHVVHNVMPVFIVQVVTCLADTLIICTILGYMQIGINPPTPEWGALFHSGRDFIRLVPRLTFLPVAAIVLTTVSLNIIGNGLRDSLSTGGGDR